MRGLLRWIWLRETAFGMAERFDWVGSTLVFCGAFQVFPGTC